MKEVCKVYKPEILSCPICNSKLTYCYTVSNKLVYFTSGKRMRIKNLGYKCENCANQTYVSQTANKLCFKGYSYSVKLVATIALMKEQGYSRDNICDFLYNKGIEISDRNIGNLCIKFKEFCMLDFKVNVKEAYKKMIDKFGQIRLSIDMVKVFDEYIVFVYDYFSTDLLGVKRIKETETEELSLFLSSFLNPEINITVISTIRKDNLLHPLMRNLVNKNVKFIPYIKF